MFEICSGLQGFLWEKHHYMEYGPLGLSRNLIDYTHTHTLSLSLTLIAPIIGILANFKHTSILRYFSNFLIWAANNLYSTLVYSIYLQ